MKKSEAATNARALIEIAQISRLRIVSMIEGTTLLALLFVAAPLKHLAGIPAVSAVVGPLHGLVFLAYLWTVIETVSGGRWSRSETVRLLMVAFLPFGSYTNHSLLKRKLASIDCRAVDKDA